MRRLFAIAASILSLCLVASAAIAAETMEGTIKKVDGAARTITFRQERADKDQVLTVDQAVDLKEVKARSKAQITLDEGVVKDIKLKARPAAAGY